MLVIWLLVGHHPLWHTLESHTYLSMDSGQTVVAAVGEHISSLDSVCGTFFFTICMAAILKYWNYCSLWMRNMFAESLPKHFFSRHKFYPNTYLISLSVLTNALFWFSSDEKIELLAWFATFESKIKKSGGWWELWQHRFTFFPSPAPVPLSSTGICHLIIHEYLNSYEMTFAPVGIQCRWAAIFYIYIKKRKNG